MPKLRITIAEKIIVISKRKIAIAAVWVRSELIQMPRGGVKLTESSQRMPYFRVVRVAILQ